MGESWTPGLPHLPRWSPDLRGSHRSARSTHLEEPCDVRRQTGESRTQPAPSLDAGDLRDWGTLSLGKPSLQAEASRPLVAVGILSHVHPLGPLTLILQNRWFSKDILETCGEQRVVGLWEWRAEAILRGVLAPASLSAFTKRELLCLPQPLQEAWAALCWQTDSSEKDNATLLIGVWRFLI